VVAVVPRGLPYVYSFDGRCYVRAGTENRLLSPDAMRRLFFQRGALSFELQPAAGATMDDIDMDKAAEYAASLRLAPTLTVEAILRRRGCLTNADGELRPTNAGILLFGKDPQSFVRGAFITAARFSGDTMSDHFNKQELYGTLPDQLRRAETFLRDHLRQGVALSSTMARSETFEYPLEAARELVVNAIAHRDYSIDGDNIRLFIFRTRMEVSSPGRLPGPVTVDNIRDERFSRNPAIVQVLSDMRYIERLGYGVDRVFTLMRDHDLRAPAFEEQAGGFRVTLYNVAETDAAASPVPADSKPIFAGVYRNIRINPRQEAALQFLHSGNPRITNSDLQALCPDVHAETIRRDLADLVIKGILHKLGEKRGSYYVLNTQ
jgi:ATP-dependent DNA helicase RecG